MPRHDARIVMKLSHPSKEYISYSVKMESKSEECVLYGVKMEPNSNNGLYKIPDLP